MDEAARARRTPFIFVGVVVAIVTLAIFRLPESLVAQIENSGPFSLSQRGWAFRLLAFFAVLQASYVGFVLLRSERVKAAREKDAKVAQLSRLGLLRSVARTGAGTVILTLVYGITAFVATGFRAGFWFFAALCLLQMAWYFLQSGEVAKWLQFQPETSSTPAAGPWVEAPPGYCPPIARALKPIEVRSLAPE
jgi:hypothetical protein